MNKLNGNFPATGYPLYVAAGDVNGDGYPELLVSGSKTTIHRNITQTNGSLSFDYPIEIGEQGGAVSLEYVNEDNKPDIVVTGVGYTKMNIYTNESAGGNIAFSTSASFSLKGFSTGLAAADFNGDGKIDFATCNRQSRSLNFLTNVSTDFGLNSFSPATATKGGIVYLIGKKLSQITSVKFGGIAASSVEIFGDEYLSAVVDTGKTGSVSVHKGQDSISLRGFRYVSTSISSFFPDTAGRNDTIRITGNDLSFTNQVLFGNIPAKSFKTQGDSLVIAVVDNGATGNVSIVTPYQTVFKSGFTFIPPPVIETISSSNAPPGSQITITGKYFTGTTKVSFADKVDSNFTVVSDTKIIVTVSGYQGGNITITTRFGTSNGVSFFNGLSISHLSSYQGLPGTTINIYGQNFGFGLNDNIVRFGSVNAEVLSASANMISVRVPNGSTYSAVSVTTNKLTAFAPKPFLQTFSNTDTSFAAKKFLPQKTLTSPYYQMAGLDVADMDGDGKLDFVIATSFLKILIYRNTTLKNDITFSLTELSAADNYIKILLEDINGDGKPDIIASNYSLITVYKNTSTPGNISFSLARHISAPVNARHKVVTADIDKDGKPDICGTFQTGEAFILRNATTDSIAFDAPVRYSIYNAQCIAIGNLDSDEKPDMVVSSSGGTKILKNVSVPGKIEFVGVTTLYSLYSPNRIMLSDLDGDGLADIAGVASDRLFVFRNLSSGNTIAFSDAVSSPTSMNIYDFDLHDLDGDGRPDIAGVSVQA